MARILRNRDGFGTAFWQPLYILFTVTGLWAQTKDVEMELESAIHREVVVGDLKGAIEQYQGILAQHPASRSIAARALLQMAQCLEKMGRRREAYSGYAQLAKEYTDQAGIANQARERMSGPRNLDFDQGTAGQAPPGWFVPALPKDADDWAELRRTGCRSSGCAVVHAPENAPIRVGGLEQSFSAVAYRGKMIRLSAWLRLQAADPEDRAQMWLSVDRPKDRKGFFDNMNDRPIRSAEWTRCEITTQVDDDATFIKFGFMSFGRGNVWVDNVVLEVVPR